jgi:hypothetical protein
MSMRNIVVVGGAVAALFSVSAVSAGAAALVSPNPCKAVPTTVIQAALGAAPAGKLTSQPAGGAKLAVCTYTRGAVKLEVEIGPKVIASGGYGGPPGMKVKSDTSLGPDGKLFYDTSPKYTFANATFTKGSFYGEVWSNKVPIAKVLLVAKSLYTSLH